MRVHIEDGYCHLAVDKVSVDDAIVTHVIWADEKLGSVERYKTNAKGEVVHINGYLCREEVMGRVKVHFKMYWKQDDKGNYVYSCGNRIKVYDRKKL